MNGFEAIDNQNLHVETHGDNPNEKKQRLFIQNLIQHGNQSTSLVFDETQRQTGEGERLIVEKREGFRC